MTSPQPDAGGLPGSDSLGTGDVVTGSLGEGVGDGATVDGGGLVGGRLDGGLLVVDGDGCGLSWLQATGPAMNAATSRAVMTGRRTQAPQFGPPPGA